MPRNFPILSSAQMAQAQAEATSEQARTFLPVLDQQRRKDPLKERLAAAPSAQEIVPRMSVAQLRNLGLDDASVAQVIADPDSIYTMAASAGERLDSFRLATVEGTQQPAKDNIAVGMLKALQHTTGLGLRGIGNLLSVYDRNVNAPFTSATVDIIQRMLPGDQQLQGLTDKILSENPDLTYTQATSRALEQSTYPMWVKEGLKAAIDPLNVALVGGLAKGLLRGALGVRGSLDVTSGTGRLLARPVSIADAMKAAPAVQVKNKFLKGPMALLDPSRTAVEHPIENVTRGYVRAGEATPALVELGMSRIHSLGPVNRFFKLDKELNVTNVGGAPKWGDLFQNAHKYKLTASQSSYITEYHKNFDEMLGLLKSAGVDVKKITFEDTMTQWVTRRVKSDTGGWKFKLVPSRKVASEAPFLKERMYDTMEEGMQDGLTYFGPEETMRMYLKAGYDEMLLRDFQRETAVFMRPAETGAREVGEATIQHKAFAGWYTDPVTANRIENALTAEGIGRWGAPSKLSGAILTARTTTDFSTPFIQGLPLLFRNSEAWSKAAILHFRSIVDPTVRARYIQKNAAVIGEMIQNEGILGSSEFVASLERGGYLAKIPGVNKALEPFARGFETMLDVGRIEAYKALRPSFVGAGDPTALNQLAEHVNKLLGAVNTKAMGVGLTQRQVESTFLMFAPRYTRAIAALHLDVLKGGLRGAEARKVLGSLYTVGALMYMRTADALGQEVNLNPSSSHFMKVQIGDQWVGPGSKVRSFLRLSGEIAEGTQKDPLGFVQFNVADVDAKTLQRNPILNWLFGQAPPVPSTIRDMVTGVSVIGRTIPLDDPIDWVKFAGKSVSPFAISGAIEEGGIRSVSALGLVGAVTTPVTERDKRNSLRDQYAGKDKWQELSQAERDVLEKGHPDLKAATDSAQKEEAKFESSKQRVEYFAQQSFIEAGQVAAANNAASQFDNLPLPGRGKVFRDALRRAMSTGADKRAQLGEDFPDVVANFDKMPKTKNVVDAAFGEYIQAVLGPGAYDNFGNYDFAKVDTIREALRQKFGDDLFKRVEAERLRRKKETAVGQYSQVVLEYWDALEALRPYFDLQKQVLTPQEQAKYQLYRSLGSPGGPMAQREFGRVVQRVEVAQERLLRKDADLDWLLVKWFDHTPKNFRNLRRTVR